MASGSSWFSMEDVRWSLRPRWDETLSSPRHLPTKQLCPDRVGSTESHPTDELVALPPVARVERAGWGWHGAGRFRRGADVTRRPRSQRDRCHHMQFLPVSSPWIPCR
jgi:hypothetical protein